MKLGEVETSLLLCVALTMVEAGLEAEEVLELEETAMVDCEAVVVELGEEAVLLNFEVSGKELLEVEMDDEVTEGFTLVGKFDTKVDEEIPTVVELVALLKSLVRVLNELHELSTVVELVALLEALVKVLSVDEDIPTVVELVALLEALVRVLNVDEEIPTLVELGALLEALVRVLNELNELLGMIDEEEEELELEIEGHGSESQPGLYICEL